MLWKYEWLFICGFWVGTAIFALLNQKYEAALLEFLLAAYSLFIHFQEEP